MSRTLFWYIFWDMLKIFGLASGVLSGIMSFGGLLRPLYEFGLDISQVGAILGWSGPAMTAYSLPIAALFATTIVYGRFSADNETTACRAAGISYLSMTMPAFVLGLLTAFLSLGLLCFAVPYSMLKVEKIIYSNLAQLIAEQIERTHQVKLDNGAQTNIIFAQSARVLPIDPSRPNDQGVQLSGPMIVKYEENADKKKPQVPKDFFMATSAVATIHQNLETDNFLMDADLAGGMKFPRSFEGGTEHTTLFSVGTSHFGPIPLESPVRENTKFMDIMRLNQVIDHPEESRTVRKTLDELALRDQEDKYLQQLVDKLNSPARNASLVGAAGEAYDLINSDATAELKKDRLELTAGAGQPVRFVQTRGTQTPFAYTAQAIRVEAFPDSDHQRIDLSVEMIDSTLVQGGTGTIGTGNTSRALSVQMPEDIARLKDRPASAYFASANPADMLKLRRGLWRLYNSAKSEIHARLSFSVSCFILVMVGCALGMMFRSGNFLSAFALSVVPALLSIALIVTGQHTCENVGWDVTNPNWTNPLGLGIALIWSGNAAVLIIGLVLLGKLQKQ